MQNKEELFEKVNEHVYNDVISRLQKMRSKNPHLTDHELLVYLVCEGYTNIFDNSPVYPTTH